MNITGQCLSSPWGFMEFAGRRDVCFKGEGGFLSLSFMGDSTLTQVSWLGKDDARLNRIYPFSDLSLEREHYGGF